MDKKMWTYGQVEFEIVKVGFNYKLAVTDRLEGEPRYGTPLTILSCDDLDNLVYLGESYQDDITYMIRDDNGYGLEFHVCGYDGKAQQSFAEFVNSMNAKIEY